MRLLFCSLFVLIFCIYVCLSSFAESLSVSLSVCLYFSSIVLLYVICIVSALNFG